MVFFSSDVVIHAIIGGFLIGLSTSVYLLFSGKIAGISGMLAQALFQKKRWMALVFLGGLIVGGSSYGTLIEPSVAFPTPPHLWLLVISGLLVGYGTRLGSGCTSGHGVCGIARLSPRSMLATLIFIGAAMMTVIIAKRF